MAPIDHPAVNQAVVQMEADAPTLYRTARTANPPLRRKLAAAFGGKDIDTRPKDISRIGTKLKKGIDVLDALQARVQVDTWGGVRDAIGKIEASGLRILGIEDTLASPGPFGSRGLKVFVEDPDVPGFVSEIELGTPFYSWFRRATWLHEQRARDLPFDREALELRITDLNRQVHALQDGDPEKAPMKYKPEVVFCGDPNLVFWGSNRINHPDHRAAAFAAIDATFPCASMELLWPEEGPAHEVHGVYVRAFEHLDTWIDVSDTIELKIKALREHHCQLDDYKDLEGTIRQRAVDAGKEKGMAFAENFRVVRLKE